MVDRHTFTIALPRRSLAEAVRSLDEMQPTRRDPRAGSSSMTQTSKERALAEAVHSMTELLPTLKDDASVVDALCAACSGNEFTSLDLMHKLLRIGAVSRSSAWMALSAQKRMTSERFLTDHLAQRPESERSPRAASRSDGLPALEQSQRFVVV